MDIDLCLHKQGGKKKREMMKKESPNWTTINQNNPMNNNITATVQENKNEDGSSNTNNNDKNNISSIGSGSMYVDDEAVSREYDVIVIGSGISGLISATLLAKSNYKVLIVENSNNIGGSIQQINHVNGYAFEYGLQDVGSEVWLGEKSKNYFASKLLDIVSEGKVEWMNAGDTYHVVVKGEDKYQIRAGLNEFKSDLIKRFPNQSKQIELYFHEVKEMQRQSVGWMYSRIPVPMIKSKSEESKRSSFFLFPKIDNQTKQESNMAEDAKSFQDKAGMTTEEMLKKIFPDNEELRYIIAYLWPKYGIPAVAGSWAAHCCVAGAYLEGAAYPKGGVGNISTQILSNFEKYGGKVMVGAKVKGLKLDTTGTSCIGIETESVGIIKAKVAVVSGIGAWNTYNKLIDGPKHPLIEPIIQSLNDLQWCSYGVIQLFVGINGDGKELKLPSISYWFLPKSTDHSDNTVRYLLDETLEVEFPYLHLSFPSAKDPEWSSRYPGKSTCVMFASARYEWFQGLSEEDVKAAGEVIVQRMVQYLLQEFPQLTDKIETAHLATPLAHEYHLNASRGSQFGLGHSPTRFEQQWLRTQSPIKNLFLTGQDVYMCGVANAAVSGYMAAAAIDQTVYKNIKDRASMTSRN